MKPVLAEAPFLHLDGRVFLRTGSGNSSEDEMCSPMVVVSSYTGFSSRRRLYVLVLQAHLEKPFVR